MSNYCIASAADRAAAINYRLTEVDVELREWRGLQYDAAQALNGRSFGRCMKNVERLEREQDALRDALKAGGK
jgi:hypothetical protein